MIITCEKCQTRFELADEKVPAAGVKVRCSKCAHVFRAKKTVARTKTLAMFRDGVPAPPQASSASPEMPENAAAFSDPLNGAFGVSNPGQSPDPFKKEVPAEISGAGPVASKDPFAAPSAKPSFLAPRTTANPAPNLTSPLATDSEGARPQSVPEPFSLPSEPPSAPEVTVPPQNPLGAAPSFLQETSAPSAVSPFGELEDPFAIPSAEIRPPTPPETEAPRAAIPGFDSGDFSGANAAAAFDPLDGLGTMNSLEGEASLEPDEAALIEKSHGAQEHAPPNEHEFTDPFADLPGFENPAKANDVFNDPFGPREGDENLENATMVREIPEHIRSMATVREKEPEPTQKSKAIFETVVLMGQALLLLVFLTLAILWGRGVTAEDIRAGRTLAVVMGNQRALLNPDGLFARDVVVTRYPSEVDEELIVISGVIENGTTKEVQSVNVKVRFSESTKEFDGWANHVVSSLEIDKAGSRFEQNRLGGGKRENANIAAGGSVPFYVLARDVPNGKRALVEALVSRAPGG